MNEINWALLQQMRDFLATEVQPEQFTMSQFLPGLYGDTIDTIKNWNTMPCGSAGCVLGHTALNPNLNPDRVGIEYFCDHKLGIEYASSLWDFLFSAEWSEEADEDGDMQDVPEHIQLQQAIHRLDQVLQYKGASIEDFEDACLMAHEQKHLTLVTTVHPTPAPTGAHA